MRQLRQPFEVTCIGTLARTGIEPCPQRTLALHLGGVPRQVVGRTAPTRPYVPLGSQSALVRKATAAPATNWSMRTPRSGTDASAISPVAQWRRERLLAAGFPADLAARLAEDCATDLHAVLELVDRGCPPALAARILAPIDDGGRPC